MNKAEWDARFHHLLEQGAAQRSGSPDAVVERFASTLPPGRALDLACGAGKNALWIAQQGWEVTAVDWSPNAIALVQESAEALGVKIKTQIANLETQEYKMEPSSWDLILMCRYFQADLFAPAKLGLAPGGVLLAIALLEASRDSDFPSEIAPLERNPKSFRVRSGELAACAGTAKGWTILHYDEAWRALEGVPHSESPFQATATIVMKRDGGL